MSEKWDLVTDDKYAKTLRLEVPSGYLYCVLRHTGAMSVCFVPRAQVIEIEAAPSRDEMQRLGRAIAEELP